MTERVSRWGGAVAAAAVLAATGAAAQRPVLLLAAAVPLVYVVYGSLSAVAAPESLAVTRHIEPTPVPPGYPVAVTLTVENEGSETLPDVRVVDAVPDELAVAEGSPRGAGALDPGEAVEIEYTVPARRGEYRFGPPRVRLRSLGAGAVATVPASVAGDDLLDCQLAAEAPPLEEQGDRYVGTMSADDPGHGMEFHSTREYQPEDPADRIDWRHYAKRGELATVDYRKRLAATIVLVVDARPAARVVAGPGHPTAVELSAYAATHALSDLLAAGHEVGVAVVGDDGPGPAGLHWVPPGAGRDHRSRAERVFGRATETRFPEDIGHHQVGRLVQLAPPDAQIAFFSPLLDEGSRAAVERWRGAGYSCSVLSPDVLTDNTVSGQFAAVERRARLVGCQAAGARTVDWRRGTPLPVALSHAFAAADRLGSTPGPRAGGDD
jgi:uncharacterized protein (DUF58 family)